MNNPSNILGVIPARFASSRFPGKPMTMIAGQSMIQRVYQQACLAKLPADVVVATDHPLIYDHVRSFGGNVVMTSDRHKTGTERCAEVIGMQPFSSFTHVVNIQGDEPIIDPDQIDLLASLLQHNNTMLATLIRPSTDLLALANPNVIKVVVDKKMKTLWFSRSPLPYFRNNNNDHISTQTSFYQHIGIYGYTSEALKTIAALTPTPNELAESLEQLRWLENGLSIQGALSNHRSCSVDAPEDVEKVLTILNTPTC